MHRAPADWRPITNAVRARESLCNLLDDLRRMLDPSLLARLTDLAKSKIAVLRVRTGDSGANEVFLRHPAQVPEARCDFDQVGLEELGTAGVDGEALEHRQRDMLEALKPGRCIARSEHERDQGSRRNKLTRAVEEIFRLEDVLHIFHALIEGISISAARQ